MPTKRLNDKTVDALKAPVPGRKQDIYYDDKLTGFGVRVTPTFKTFIVETRVKGRNRRVSIGKWGPLSTVDARERAKKLLGQMVGGIDPNKAKLAEKTMSLTLEEVFEEYKQRKPLSDKTITVYDGAFERCLSEWHNKRVTDITKDMVEQRYNKLLNKTWERGTTGQAQTSQGMRLLSALLNFAMNVHDDSDGNPIILYNPVKRLSHIQRGWSKGERRQGVILDGELRSFYEGVMKLKNQTARDYFLFLILTGLRRNEAAALRWDEVDLKNKFLQIEGERTKNKKPHALPLTSFLYQMLKRRSEANKRKSLYVFPGSLNNKNGHYLECKSAYNSVGKDMGKKFIPHDLRRTFITVAEKLRIDYYALKRLLNHSNGGDITSSYIITEIARLRKPMREVNAYILKHMGVTEPLQPVDNVTPFARKQGTDLKAR